MPGWAGKEVLAVAAIDGKAYLVADEPGDGIGPVPAEDLTPLGVTPDSTVRVLGSGARQVMVWTTANRPTHVATLDVARGVVTRRSYSVDAGLIALDGDILYVGRAAGSGATIDRFSLVEDRVLGSVGIPFLPDELVAWHGALVVLKGAVTVGQGAVIRGSDVGPIFRIRPGGAIAGAAPVDGRLLVALGTYTSAAGSQGATALVSGPIGGDLSRVGRVQEPQLVAGLDDRTALAGDLVGGRRVVHVVDARTGRTLRSSSLRSDAALQALVVTDPRHVTVVQSDGWTEVDTDSGTAVSWPLPGTVISTQ
jgi:hypothetical protein